MKALSWIISKYWKQFIFAKIFLKYSYLLDFWFCQDSVVLFFLLYSNQTSMEKPHVPHSDSLSRANQIIDFASSYPHAS